MLASKPRSNGLTGPRATTGVCRSVGLGLSHPQQLSCVNGIEAVGFTDEVLGRRHELIGSVEEGLRHAEVVILGVGPSQGVESQHLDLRIVTKLRVVQDRSKTRRRIRDTFFGVHDCSQTLRQGGSLAATGGLEPPVSGSHGRLRTPVVALPAQDTTEANSGERNDTDVLDREADGYRTFQGLDGAAGIISLLQNAPQRCKVQALGSPKAQALGCLGCPAEVSCGVRESALGLGEEA